MIKGLQKSVGVEIRIKDMSECGGTMEGIKCNLRFMKTARLSTRVLGGMEREPLP